MEPTADDKLVAIGVIAGAHGIGGEVRVFPFNPDTDHLEPEREVQLRAQDGRCATHRVTRSRQHKKYVLVKLDGIDDRNHAEALRGTEVLVPRAALLPTDDDEFYVEDLVGLAVDDEVGNRLGEVREVFQTPAHSVLVVADERVQGERLVPWTDDALVEVEVAKGRIVVRRALTVWNAS